MSDQRPSVEALIVENAQLRVQLSEAQSSLRELREQRPGDSNRLGDEMLAFVNDAVIAIDQDQRVLYCNAAAERQYGLAATQAIGGPLSRLFETKWFRPDDESAANAAMRDHGQWRGECGHLRHDGVLFEVEASVSVLWGPDGQRRGTLAVVRDISRRKQAEYALAEREHYLQRIVDVTPGFLHIFDLEDRLTVFINRTGASSLGYTPDDLRAIGYQYLSSLMHPNDLSRFERHIERLRTLVDRQYVEFEYRMRSQSGDWHWFSSRDAVFSRDPTGAVRQIIGSALDITERKQAEAALRNAERRFELALSNSPVAVFEHDAELRYTWVYNSKLGYSNAFPIGKTDSEIMDPACVGPVVDVKRRALESGQTILQEVAAAAPGCPLEYFDLFVEPRRDEAGKVVGLMCVATDITGRKRTEEHNKLLMAEVNHRAKNLLAVVQAISSLTARESDPATFATQLSQRINGLAACHDLLVESQWQGANLADLAKVQLAHFQDLIGSRVLLDGPALRLDSGAAQGIGMALHELATNSVKYGALSNDVGQVSITWQISTGPEPAQLTIVWRETDGPVVAPPERSGFGRTVIGHMVEAAVDGVTTVEFRPSGMIWTLVAPAARALLRRDIA